MSPGMLFKKIPVIKYTLNQRYIKLKNNRVRSPLIFGEHWSGIVKRALPSHQCGSGFESWRRCHMWVEFVVGSLPCSERFFSGDSGFSLSLKNNTWVVNGSYNLEKHGSQKILAGSRNLGSVFDESRSLVFAWFVYTFFESRNFLTKSLGLRFLTRISASQRVLDFTICHPHTSKF